MHLLLIQPPNRNQVWAGVSGDYMNKGFHAFPPQQIMALSAYLKAHTQHRVTMLDCQKDQLDYDQIQRRIAEINPDIVGTTSNTHLIYDVHRVTQAAKALDPKLPVIMGGSHVWSYPLEAMALPEVDYAIRGDGERPLVQLLEALEQGGELGAIRGLLYRDEHGEIVRNPEQEPHKDLDGLPFPDREGLDLDGYYTAGMVGARCSTMVTSRGCPYDCPFCSTYTTYRHRSAANVADEFEHCQRLGITEIYFVDDTFNMPERRLRELADELLRRKTTVTWATKMTCAQLSYETLARARAAGLVRVHLGVEAGTPEGQLAIGKSTSELDHVRKVFGWCNQLGIKSAAYMMLGLPSERSAADIMRSAAFVEQIDPTFVIWALYSPYPDTKLWQDGAKLGLWRGDEWLKHMVAPTARPNLPVAWTEHIPQPEQERILKKLMFRFYTRPKRIVRLAGTIRSTAALRKTVRTGVTVLASTIRR